MKKGNVWIWILFSIIAGLLFISLMKNLYSHINSIEIRETSMKDFNDLFSDINSVCDSEIGYEKKIEYKIYPCVNFISTEKLDKEIETKVSGNFICINITKNIICRKLKCNINMSVLGYESPENDPFSKNKGYTCYTLFIKKINATTVVLCPCRCEVKDCECDNI